MHIIREIFPNEMPFIIEGSVDNEGVVDPTSVRMFPVIHPPELPPFIGEPLEIKENNLADRLNFVLNKQNDTT